MNEYIAFDSHKHYTLMERQNAQTGRTVQQRLAHQRGALCAGLRECAPGNAVAVEATGNWYWIVGEIEQAGLRPLLVHPRKAKLMMGLINKTDELDVHGLNRLQQNGTLPTVWIPPAPLRDLRELTRTRLVLVASRTKLKNRLQATLAKHGLVIVASDPFGVGARKQWEQHLPALPTQSRFVTEQLLQQVDFLGRQIEQQEIRLKGLLAVTPAMQRLASLPGFGLILATTVALEIGDIHRFATGEHLASYAGTTPRVHSSGDKTRYGQLRADVNRYLKWAYIEAANVVSLQQKRWAHRHVVQLYWRIRQRRGHAKAVGAVARHLAEASFWVLRRNEDYHEPARPGKEVSQPGSSATTA
jgi:transposase